MALYSDKFFCSARENTIWKVIVSDVRNTACEITVTITTPSRKVVKHIVHGVRQLVLLSRSSSGVCGYPLTEEGLGQFDAALVNMFLA